MKGLRNGPAPSALDEGLNAEFLGQTMADKGALEFIGLMLFAATLFVVGAGGFAVRHQLAAESNGSEIAQLSKTIKVVKASITPGIVK